jgi:hypothetical protein
MFGIVSRCTRKRNLYAARVKIVSMRSFASAINKSTPFQIGNELPNFAGHTHDTISEWIRKDS